MVLKSFSGSRPVCHRFSGNSQVERFWLLQWGGRLSQRQNKPAEAGFTLIEALMAMLIVSIVMVAITPPIFMATASRIQQRKAQQALQLAQGEIDRVRTLVERGNYALTDLPAQVSDLNAAPAASSVLGSLRSVNSTCNTYTGAQLGATQFLPVDVTGTVTSGSCQPGFLLQSFRTAGPGETATDPPKGFRMAVRVYADTPALRQSLGSLSTQRASLKMTSGLGQ